MALYDQWKNNLAAVIGDIDLDFPGVKEESNNRVLEAEYQRKKKY